MISVEFETQEHNLELVDAMQNAAKSAISAEEVGDCALCIVVVDEKEIQRLNCGFRSKDAVTDVLSFPANDLLQPLAQAMKEGYKPEMEEGEIYLGDIAICEQRAREQAVAYGNTFQEEMCFLTVHGCLHLLGYDHEEETDEVLMREKQGRALGRRSD